MLSNRCSGRPVHVWSCDRTLRKPRVGLTHEVCLGGVPIRYQQARRHGDGAAGAHTHTRDTSARSFRRRGGDGTKPANNILTMQCRASEVHATR